MRSALDDSRLTMQLVLLLAYLPVIAALAVMGLWALLRLHERPRAGWIVLWMVALTGLQLGGVSFMAGGVNLLANVVGVPGIEFLYLIMLPGHYVLEIAMWWLVLRGLFGADPFRLWSLTAELSSTAE
jgi:hypothetical protein